MVFQLTDFTDSEASTSPPPPEASSAPSTPRRGPSGSGHVRRPSARGGGNTPGSSRVSASPRGQSARDRDRDAGRGPSAAHPLRITLRTGSAQSSDPPPTHRTHPPPTIATSQRSSLSPPPPITLKISRQTLAEKASYSSSEEDEDERMTTLTNATPRPVKRPAPESEGEPELEPPSYFEEDDIEGDKSYNGKAGKPKKGPNKRAKTTTSSSAAKKAVGTATETPPEPKVKGSGNNRKSYGWLAPSSVSASHAGPKARAGPVKTEVGAEGSEAGTVEGDGMDVDEKDVAGPSVPAVPIKKKQVRKKVPVEGGVVPAKVLKPKKAPKKIAKALMSDTLLDLAGVSNGATPSLAGGISARGTPEPNDLTPSTEIAAPAFPRGNTPPFDPADATKLGFPVFAKPIEAPKFGLGTFPRVTQWFAPVNGGDTILRKEKVRQWKDTSSTFKGIGGGTLVYKTWTKGPSSDLGRLIQADRDAKAIKQSAKKASLAQAAASASSSTPLFVDSSLATIAALTKPRPSLNQATSSDSIPQLPGAQGEAEEAGSEVGDEASEAAPVVVKPVKKRASTGAAGKLKVKAQPRKSKLAQEIVPLEPEVESGAGDGISTGATGEAGEAAEVEAAIAAE